ncbi:hypothetical protein ANN_02208 [Periplaneta americana]|uniref:Reverse transcriptase domain-containing protein n=1 Tax=Periplaneta americana TaxID=6978 RepID=A0ABQ8TVQ4_PERAM|nr:hypothetical protein ANN_02208 [Periplaneta americana]
MDPSTNSSNTPQNVHASTENTSVINSNDSELKELYSRGREQSMSAKMHQLSVQESSTGKLEEKNKSVSAVPVITTEKMEPEYKSDGNAAAYMEGGGKAKLQDDSTQIGTNKTELQTSSTVLPIGTKKHNNSQESLNDSLSNTDHDIRNSSVVPRKGVDITNNELGLETTSTILPSEKATQNNSQEYVIRKVQDNGECLEFNGLHQLFVYADDVNMLGENPQSIRENMGILLEASKEIGLEVNLERQSI